MKILWATAAVALVGAIVLTFAWVRYRDTTNPDVEWTSIGCPFSAKRMLTRHAPPDIERLVLRGVLHGAPAELRPTIELMITELTPAQAENMDAMVDDYCERAA